MKRNTVILLVLTAALLLAQQPVVVQTSGDNANGAVGSGVPAGAVYAGCQALTSYPTAASTGNLTGETCDKAGRPVVVLNGMRDISGAVYSQNTSSTYASLISAGGSGVYNDITSISCSNEGSTATVVTINDDGTSGNTYVFNIAGAAGAYGGIVLTGGPLKQGTSNAAWEMKNSGSATIDCNLTYVSNK